ncbi:rho GDP dissociation inhibitor [Capsaspora owczarzaki ATCC 30864]|uniref:Rho GDP dissociation inhibitor n=1 Tax=Capsaspora owczarzaki (strain ATCC 30864) TaxID=595528 RepID=A0A0D2WYH1_CAPO3|nr:rho GDP dissociation inhibitor [Capsaspora owczarzaki ATCC 30864]KJE97988.1 rho GDP dissociation inhibitor [Capsaspora owczarzaki ATCC 30864]|eukprot:XP_004342648.1 rho GDP dissociation inhibitor [Capsaspora owczarzaki ATCC 30864]
MADEDIEVEETPGYKAPKAVDLDTLKNLDANDESLKKWKESLLKGSGGASATGKPVVVQKLSLVVADRSDVALDLTGDLNKLKDAPFTIKEGCEYRIKIGFTVNKLVAGLRYVQAVYRKGIKVDNSSVMVGSYGPNAEPYVYTSQVEEAPSGMLARGHYTVKSKFIDDDKVSHLDWQWSFDIAKDW